MQDKLGQTSDHNFKRKFGLPIHNRKEKDFSGKILKKTDLQVKLINFALDRIMPIHSQDKEEDPFHTKMDAIIDKTDSKQNVWTLVDIFKPDTPFLFKINIESGYFPIKISIR